MIIVFFYEIINFWKLNIIFGFVLYIVKDIWVFFLEMVNFIVSFWINLISFWKFLILYFLMFEELLIRKVRFILVL